jgi:CNT family concentrative nucleoside transporter
MPDYTANLRSFFGLLIFLGICFALSTNRKAINYRTVGVGLAIQVVLGLLLIRIEGTSKVFEQFGDTITSFLNLSRAGASIVFGPLGDPTSTKGLGFIIGTQVLPTIIFFSAFISVLYYLGVIQVVISGIAYVMKYLMGTSGSETLSCSANIFVGQTEAPLLIKPFLGKMTASEINAVMIGGFATIAGSVLGAYVSMGIPATSLIAASVMAAPGALVVAKILVPETEVSETSGGAKMPRIDAGENLVDAAALGTSDGLRLALNVGAMLIAFTALMAVVNWIMGGLDYLIDGQLLGGALRETGTYEGYFPATIEVLLGYIFQPVVWMLGISWEDSKMAGSFLGIKIILNEFVAYATMTGSIEELDPRTVFLMSFALCGFANIASIGIQVGGIGALAEGRRKDISRLAVRAMIGGVLVSLITASIAGTLDPWKYKDTTKDAPAAVEVSTETQGGS